MGSRHEHGPEVAFHATVVDSREAQKKSCQEGWAKTGKDGGLQTQARMVTVRVSMKKMGTNPT